MTNMIRPARCPAAQAPGTMQQMNSDISVTESNQVSEPSDHTNSVSAEPAEPDVPLNTIPQEGVCVSKALVRGDV